MIKVVDPSVSYAASKIMPCCGLSLLYCNCGKTGKCSKATRSGCDSGTISACGSDCPLKAHTDIFTIEAQAINRQLAAKRPASDTDPFYDEFQVKSVRYEYPAGTLQKYISEKLAGKAMNPSMVAGELAENINALIYHRHDAPEVRAVDRETAVRNAEYIAQTFFDDPSEATAFMGEINRFAENDIFREKGVLVIYDTAARVKYFYRADRPAPYDEFDNREDLEAYLHSLLTDTGKWGSETVDEYTAVDKKIDGIIKRTKETLDPARVQKSLERLLKAF